MSNAGIKEKLIKFKADFEQGVRAYVNGKFAQASKIFENVYKKNSKYFNEILDSYSGFDD